MNEYKTQNNKKNLTMDFVFRNIEILTLGKISNQVAQKIKSSIPFSLSSFIKNIYFFELFWNV